MEHAGPLAEGEAAPLLERALRLVPVMPHWHNNLAMAYWMLGRIPEAIATAEKVDREVWPGNVFTMASLVHYYLLVGRAGEATAVLRRLLASAPPGGSAAHKKCEALARFDRHEGVPETAGAAA